MLTTLFTVFPLVPTPILQQILQEQWDRRSLGTGWFPTAMQQAMSTATITMGHALKRMLLSHWTPAQTSIVELLMSPLWGVQSLKNSPTRLISLFQSLGWSHHYQRWDGLTLSRSDSLG